MNVYVWLSCLSWTLLYINNIQRMLNKDLTRFMQSVLSQFVINRVALCTKKAVAICNKCPSHFVTH